MAKGAQDWIARTDILLQSLSEIIQRPRLGTINVVDVSGNVAANTANLVMAIIGAGMHFGGYIYGDSSGVIEDDYITVVADGNTVIFPTVKKFYDYGFTQPVGAEGFCTYYDPVNFRYGFAISQGKTWNTSYLMYYTEAHGRNPYVNLKFIYATF